MELNNSDQLLLRSLGISDYDFYVIGPKGAKVYDALYDLLSKKIDKLVDNANFFSEKSF